MALLRNSKNRPAIEAPRYPNRLREIRRLRGMTIEQVADSVGASVPTVQRREKGDVKLKVDELDRYAQALQTEPNQILPGATLVPVIGKVGAGAQVIPVDEEHMPIDEVEGPAHLDPLKTVAYETEGDSMFPLENGWLIFVAREPTTAAEDLIGRLCVVKIAETGAVMVKQLRRGFDRGRYTLVSSNASPIENVRLEWAVGVEGMLPPAKRPLLAERAMKARARR